MINVYILQLVENKYYVGRTNEPIDRIPLHFEGKGCAWTKKYLPIKIEKVMPDCDEFDELKWTLIYMNLKGIENVRGSNFCQINLTDNEKQNILRLIRGALNLCYICGKKGHFATECEDYEYEKELNELLEQENKCTRCYKIGHISKNCKEKTYSNGKIIREIRCTRCYRIGHLENKCYAKKYENGKMIKNFDNINLNDGITNKDYKLDENENFHVSENHINGQFKKINVKLNKILHHLNAFDFNN